MSEINFITNNNIPKKGKKPTGGHDNASEIVWSHPVGEVEAGNDSMPGTDKKTGKIPSGSADSNNLSMRNTSTGAAPARFSGFLSGLFSNIGKKGKEKVITGDFSRDKKMISDQMEMTRNKRNNHEAAAGETNRQAGRFEPTPGQQPDNKNSGSPIGSGLWKAPRVLKTNLISDEITTFIDWKKNVRLLTVCLVMTCFVVALAYAGLSFWMVKTQQQGQFYTQEINSLDQKVKQAEKDVQGANNFRTKLIMVQKLLDQHIYWTKLFSFLNNTILSNAYYSGGFSGDTNGQYIFNESADSYSAISDQIAVLRSQSEVKSVDVTSGELKKTKSSGSNAGSNGSNVDFSIAVTLDPSIFTK